jgi:hypothetical protein
MKLTENQIEEAVDDQLEKTLKYTDLNAIQVELENTFFNNKEVILDYIVPLIREACRDAIEFEETVAAHNQWFHAIVHYYNDDSDPKQGPWICCNLIVGGCSCNEEETQLRPAAESEIIEKQQKQIEELKSEVKDLRIALHKSGGGGNYAVRTKTY